METAKTIGKFLIAGLCGVALTAILVRVPTIGEFIIPTKAKE